MYGFITMENEVSALIQVCPDRQLDWLQICCIHFKCTQKEEVWGLTEENKDCRVEEMYNKGIQKCSKQVEYADDSEQRVCRTES